MNLKSHLYNSKLFLTDSELELWVLLLVEYVFTFFFFFSHDNDEYDTHEILGVQLADQT